MLRQLIQNYLINETGIEASKFDNPDLTVAEFGLDSLGVVEMLFEVEDQYGFQIEDPLRFTTMTFNAMVADMEVAIRAKNNGEIPSVKP
jgi:acyl carrier protein